MLILVIAVGGAAGALARYGLAGAVQNWTSAGFPWGTLVVNAVGSLALGFLFRWLLSSTASPEVRAFVTVGFLGGFTTFSTFSYEALALAQEGEWGRFAGYVAGSVVLGLAGAWSGYEAAGMVTRGG